MPGFGGWFSTKELSGGGPLIDLGVHRLDLALWFMGYPEPLYVTGATYNPIAQEIARRENKNFSVEDLAVGFIYFKNGASLSIEASWAANIQENEIMETRIFGTKGGLLHKNRGEAYQFEAHFYTEQNGHLWDQTLHEGSLWSAGIQKTPTAMVHFIDAIYHNYPHDADGKQGLVVMQLLDALYTSAQTKKPVFL
jgi:predicted dehydrogenase